MEQGLGCLTTNCAFTNVLYRGVSHLYVNLHIFCEIYFGLGRAHCELQSISHKIIEQGLGCLTLIFEFTYVL